MIGGVNKRRSLANAPVVVGVDIGMARFTRVVLRTVRQSRIRSAFLSHAKLEDDY